MSKWWHLVKGAVDPADCAALIEYARNFKPQEATVLTKGKSDVMSNQRAATVRFIPRFDPNMLALYAKFQTWMLQANAAYWGIDYQDFHQVQVACYQPEHGHHCWHKDCALFGVDMGTAWDRKLTLVLQLSDPSDYEGGTLELEHGDLKPDQFARGDALIFPAMLKHRVLPVTRGTRYSLSTWAVGPRWR